MYERVIQDAMQQFGWTREEAEKWADSFF